MNGEIFTQYVTKLDRRKKRDNRKIALIVDNCTAHPTDIQGLQAVKLCFLPPNTTKIAADGCWHYSKPQISLPK